MTRFVITGNVSQPTDSLCEADVINPSKLQEKLAKMKLEVEKIESVGEDVTYYLKESKGPKLLCG